MTCGRGSSDCGLVIFVGPDLMGDKGAAEGMRATPCEGRPLLIGCIASKTCLRASAALADICDLGCSVDVVGFDKPDGRNGCGCDVLGFRF